MTSAELAQPIGDVVVRDADLAGERVDVLVRHGVVASIDMTQGEGGRAGGLDHRADRLIDAGGGAILPGLWDHHIHLPALAVASRSVPVGPPAVASADGFAERLRSAVPDGFGWIRAVGYHESVAGPLTRHDLDRIRSDVAIRVQHRSGGLWIFNTRAMTRLLDDAAPSTRSTEQTDGITPDGLLLRNDAWLAERLARLRDCRHPNGAAAAEDHTAHDDLDGGLEEAVSSLGRRLARLGVVGCTEASPGLSRESAQLISRSMPQHLRWMSSAPWTAGLDEGSEAWSGSTSRIGAFKIMVTEDALPPLDGPGGLVAAISGAHRRRRCVAVHVVTRTALALVVAGFDQAGVRPGDRIEHGSVCPPELSTRVADLGLTVVSQPNFIAERGDQYRQDVDADDQPWLYRLAGLSALGIPVGGGTDAPFGDPDPWAAMAAAVSRTSSGGEVLGAEEALSPEAALALFTTAPEDPGGSPRRVEVGAAADLCLIDRPWSSARADLAAVKVKATLIGGGRVRSAGEAGQRQHQGELSEVVGHVHGDPTSR